MCHVRPVRQLPDLPQLLGQGSGVRRIERPQHEDPSATGLADVPGGLLGTVAEPNLVSGRGLVLAQRTEQHVEART